MENKKSKTTYPHPVKIVDKPEVKTTYPFSVKIKNGK